MTDTNNDVYQEIIALAIDDACVGADAEGLERAAKQVLDHLREGGYRIVSESYLTSVLYVGSFDVDMLDRLYSDTQAILDD